MLTVHRMLCYVSCVSFLYSCKTAANVPQPMHSVRSSLATMVVPGMKST